MPNKTIISPAQGLLLLIDHYRNQPNPDLAKIEQLKKYYLSGARNEKDKNDIKNLLQDDVLNKYEISYSNDVINDDPTRRYFETHLAYETSRGQLQELSLDELKTHYDTLSSLVPFDLFLSREYVLNGEFNAEDKDNVNREYAYCIAKINKGGILGPSETADDREKLKLLVQCCYLSAVNTSCHDAAFPIAIYSRGIYSQENRGKLAIQDQESTRNPNFGILRGEMPVPETDIARATGDMSEAVTPYLRPSDQSQPAEKAKWVKDNFEQMVHPFSNSISGTMLCQLRTLAFLRSDGTDVMGSKQSAEGIEKYLTLSTAVMLFMSGGHSLHEYTAPISLPEVKEEYKDVPGFDQISLDSMFYEHNEKNFNKALDNAIQYNKMILLRKEVQNQVKGNNSSGIIDPLKPALAYLKLIQELNAVSIKVESILSDNEEADVFSHMDMDLLIDMEIIAEKIPIVLNYLAEGKIEAAKDEISALKTELGEYDSQGEPKDNYKLVDSLEKDLEQILHCKERTKSIKSGLHQITEGSEKDLKASESNDQDLPSTTPPQFSGFD